MPITDATEQIVSATIVSRISSVYPFSNRVIPAPLYFEDRADFWSVDPGTNYDDRKELDTSHIVFAALFYKGFEDDPDTPEDSPLVTLRHELYCFSEYDLERVDETSTPDAYNRRLLKRIREFVAGLINLKAEFQGIVNVTGTGLMIAETLPLTQTEDVQPRVNCEYIPNVVGTSAKFEVRTRLQSEEC